MQQHADQIPALRTSDRPWPGRRHGSHQLVLPSIISYLEFALFVCHVGPKAAAMVLGLAAIGHSSGRPLAGTGRQPCTHRVAPAHGCWAAFPVIKRSCLASSVVRATRPLCCEAAAAMVKSSGSDGGGEALVGCWPPSPNSL